MSSATMERIARTGVLILCGMGILLSQFAVAIGAEAEAPGAVLARLETAYAAIQDYRCRIIAFTRKGSRTDQRELRFSFRKPGMARARVLRGSGRGSEVARDRSGKLHGRRGGLLSPFVVSLKETDSRVRNLRGVPFWEADWGVFLQRIREALADPAASAATQAAPDGSLELTIRFQGPEPPVRHFYRVDTARWLITEADVYEGNELVDQVRYEECQLNPGLTDRDFEL
jgi:hypothetical protein